MTEVLEKYLLRSDKAGIVSGLKSGFIMNITEVRLNKACTLLHVFWD